MSLSGQCTTKSTPEFLKAHNPAITKSPERGKTCNKNSQGTISIIYERYSAVG